MLSKFQGVLVGAAVGEALSAPVQFLSKPEIRERYVEVRDLLGGGWLRLRLGQSSADLQMMVCVIESILDEGSFKVDSAVQKLLQWFKTRPQGVGKTTTESLRRLSQGESWRTASSQVYARRPHESAGNGALVRSIPLALRYLSNRASLISHSTECALITHADPLATTATVLLSLMISNLIQAGKKEPRVESIQELFGNQDNRWKNSFDEIDYLEAEDLIASGFVLDTLQSALWCYLKTESFEEAVIVAVNRGDDVVSLSAVTGALAGAHYGIEQIPARWQLQLEHRDALMLLAEKIYRQIFQ